jgi:superfamily II DNA or RNA helicase
MQLRPYQLDLLERIQAAWSAGQRNVLAVLPTGAGKTIMFTKAMQLRQAPAVAIAHRQELVGQISVALGHHGVCHRIVAPRSVVRFVVGLHMETHGRSYYDPQAPVAVAGVDTFIRREAELAAWLPSVRLWVQDEAHHVLRSNKWGKAAAMLPNAQGLGVTATAGRADGKGLGRHADGVFDVLLEGVSMRDTINEGYLTDYRIFAPSTADLDLSDVPVTSSGDYSKPKLTVAVRRSRIVGDVVEHYQRIAPGKLGLTFVTDVETATEVAAAYEVAGVPAAVISHKTPDRMRAATLRQFKRREILQLVNVDLFGEGFDLPAVEVVSFARPTQSYGLYVQQFGRGLRILEGKRRAVIIDHVGNVVRHGLPDALRVWSLDRRDRQSRQPKDVIPVRVCPTCTGVYERIYKICPYCQYCPIPSRRSAPEHVDGDLLELDAATLARMRGAVAGVDLTADAYREQLIARGCPAVGIGRNVRYHERQQAAQRDLRAAIAQWAGYQRAADRPDSESYRRFYLLYGIDVLSAQALGVDEARELTRRIEG